jgi:hypothetical protein
LKLVVSGLCIPKPDSMAMPASEQSGWSIRRRLFRLIDKRLFLVTDQVIRRFVGQVSSAATATPVKLLALISVSLRLFLV